MQSGPRNNLLIDSSDGVWIEIAQYLSLEDIASLKLACKALNGKFNDPKLDVLWQPYLNQLHAIDYTISVTPASGKTLKETFVAGLNKIRDRQNAEILCLSVNQGIDIFQDYHVIQKIHVTRKSTLQDVIAIDEALNAINNRIIDRGVCNAKKHKSKQVFLEAQGLTRLPEDMIEKTDESFWSKVSDLNCERNFIEKFSKNITKLKTLKSLNLAHNELESIPLFLAELTELDAIKLEGNKLRVLPTFFARMQKLSALQLHVGQVGIFPECFYTKINNDIILGENQVPMGPPLSPAHNINVQSNNNKPLTPLLNEHNKRARDSEAEGSDNDEKHDEHQSKRVKKK